MQVGFNPGMTHDRTAEAVRVIDALDGPTGVAALCGDEITPQAVSQWKRAGIPPGWRMYLRAVRPHLFDSHESARAQSAISATRSPGGAG